MIEWFTAGGFFMWFVLGAALVGLVLAIDAGRRLAGRAEDAGDSGRRSTGCCSGAVSRRCSD